MTCKWGVWRVVQARERSKSRGRARGGRWLKDGDGCGILKIGYGDALLLDISTYMVEDSFVALNYRCRGLPQKNQSDLTQTARKPRAVSHFTAYSDALSAYISKKYMQIIGIVACLSAHNTL